MDELDGSIVIPTIVSGDMEGIQPRVSGLSNLSIWDMISDDSSGMNTSFIPPASPSENLVGDGFVFQQLRRIQQSPATICDRW